MILHNCCPSAVGRLKPTAPRIAARLVRGEQGQEQEYVHVHVHVQITVSSYVLKSQDGNIHVHVRAVNAMRTGTQDNFVQEAPVLCPDLPVALEATNTLASAVLSTVRPPPGDPRRIPGETGTLTAPRAPWWRHSGHWRRTAPYMYRTSLGATAGAANGHGQRVRGVMRRWTGGPTEQNGAGQRRAVD